MSERDIVQGLVERAGQAQRSRILAALDPASAPLDCRTRDELLRVTRELAKHLPFRSTSGGAATWAQFFALDDAQLAAAAAAGETPPHLALLLAFAEVYAHPRAVLNGLTERHLDHYYRQVLRLRPRRALPDRAHLVVETKQAAARTELHAGHRFSAGKDASGRELVYAPVRTAVVGPASVASLRSAYLEAGAHGRLRCAPVANSADGLGAALAEHDPAWAPFGHPGLPLAEVGFAVGAPVLRLRAGARSIAVTLALDAPLPALPAGSFVAFLTGPKGWIGPFAAGPNPSGEVLRVAVEVPPNEPAIVDLDPAVHGYSATTGTPLMQCLFRGDGGGVGHGDLAAAFVRSVEVDVAVRDLAPEAIANEHGTGAPDRPFQPFGTEPTRGARFLVHCADVLAQPLTELELALQWRDPPAQLASHYAAYRIGRGVAQGAGNGSFTAEVCLEDAGGWHVTETRPLFDADDARRPHTLRFVRGAAPKTGGAGAIGSGPATTAFGVGVARRGPAFARAAIPAAGRFAAARALAIRGAALAGGASVPGAISLRVNQGFLHREYRQRFVAAVLAASRSSTAPTLPEEPYTPTLDSIRIHWKAHAGPVPLDDATEGAFASAEVAFHHVGCFGHRREHAFLRSASSARPGTRVPLLPEPPRAGAGELYVGLSGATPGDSVNLLLQMLPGTADPDAPTPTVQWSVLCDDHWHTLGPRELTLDTTNGLLRSGIVQVQLPSALRLDHAMMPAGLTWLRATSDGPADAVCRALDVRCNAVEVVLVSEGNDPGHLSKPLPAGSITRLATPIATIKQVSQPFAGFGGAPAEQPGPFRTRVSERLRHKDRAITIWDFERIVLDTFPAIHRVKCIPHSRPGAWLVPGHVTLVAIADVRGQHGAQRLQPRVDADTLARVRRHVQQRAGQHVRVAVVNPRFDRIALSLEVRFRAGEDFNHRRTTLNEALVRALSPWAFDGEHELQFGGAVHRSQLLQLVEDLPYVDFVRAFRMTAVTAAGSSGDLHVARPGSPDAVLVSEPAHTILPVP